MAQDHVTLDQVFQFSDVSRPVIFLQYRQHFVRHGPCAAIELAVVVFEKVAAQIFNVATALPQRRHVKIHHIDAVVKILAKSTRFDLGFQAAVGRAHHAHLDLLVFLSADPAELPILQKLQKLRLQRGVKLGNLAERLRQRTYRKCRHKTEYPIAVSVHPHALKVHPKHQTREESRTTWKSSPKCSTYEQLEVMISREWEDRAWHQRAIMRRTREGKNSSHRRTGFPQMLAGNSCRVGVQGTGELQT